LRYLGKRGRMTNKDLLCSGWSPRVLGDFSFINVSSESRHALIDNQEET